MQTAPTATSHQLDRAASPRPARAPTAKARKAAISTCAVRPRPSRPAAWGPPGRCPCRGGRRSSRWRSSPRSAGPARRPARAARAAAEAVERAAVPVPTSTGASAAGGARAGLRDPLRGVAIRWCRSGVARARRSGLPVCNVRGISSISRSSRGAAGRRAARSPTRAAWSVRAWRRGRDDGGDDPRPHSSSGRPTTTASATSGWVRSAASTAAGETLTPPVMTTSSNRPVTVSRSSARCRRRGCGTSRRRTPRRFLPDRAGSRARASGRRAPRRPR